MFKKKFKVRVKWCGWDDTRFKVQYSYERWGDYYQDIERFLVQNLSPWWIPETFSAIDAEVVAASLKSIEDVKKRLEPHLLEELAYYERERRYQENLINSLPYKEKYF